jgi:hypothetical protein
MLEAYNSAGPPTIEGEAQHAATNPLDIGNLTAAILTEFGLIGDPEPELEFMIPAIRESMCEIITVGSQYDLNPEKLSFERHGTHEMAYLLMRVNGFTSRNDFVGPVLRVIRQGSEQDVLQVCQEARRRAEAKRKAPPAYEDLTLRTIRT